MRLLILRHRVADSSRIEAAARENSCTNISSLQTRDADQAVTLVSIENSADMRRGSISREARSVARAQLDSVPQVRWITGDATIYGEGSEAVLVTAVRAQWLGSAGREAWRGRLTEDIRVALRARGYPEPLVELTLLD